MVQLESIESWQVAVEPNGFLGADLERMAALSAGGRAASVYWNVNMLASFAYAEWGAIVRSVDPVLYADGGTGAHLKEESGLPFADDPLACSVALIERLTRIRIEGTWVHDRSRRTFTARPPCEVRPLLSRVLLDAAADAVPWMEQGTAPSVPDRALGLGQHRLPLVVDVLAE